MSAPEFVTEAYLPLEIFQNNVIQDNKDERGQNLETRFLLACLKNRSDINQDSNLLQFSGKNLNWNIIFNLAYVHGLLPLIHLQLTSHPISYCPEEFLKTISEHFRANELRNRMLREEFRKISTAFREANVRAIPIKGIVYSSTIYENPSARQFADIDFLLQEADIEAAKLLLENLGYRSVYGWMQVTAGNTELTPLQNSIYRSIYHEYAFMSHDGLINIDLHWRLSPGMYPTCLPVDLVWHNLVATTINGVHVDIFKEEIDILYLCLHAAKDGWGELKWAVDISELIRNHDKLDWQRVWQLSKQLRCSKILLVGMAMAEWVTGVALPTAALEKISSSRTTRFAIGTLQRRLMTKPERKFSYIPCIGINVTYLMLCDSIFDQARYVFRMLTYTQPRDFNLFGLTGEWIRIWPLLRPFRLMAYCTRKALMKLIN